MVGEEARPRLAVKDMDEHPLKVVKVNVGSFWGIRREGGGHVPLPLKGWWTCEAYAQRALDEFQA